MFITKLIQCHNYKNIEDRIGSILTQFKDKPGSRKEMIHLRYDLLVQITDFICDNYDREVEYINTHCQKYLAETIESDGAIPEAIDINTYLGDQVNITVNKSGKVKIHKVDISRWEEAEINALIEEIINRCAAEKKKIEYDFATQKNSTELHLAWGLVTPYLELYRGLTKTEWRAKFKNWFTKEEPKQLKIRGLKV
jgi:vacuolar-type H+-ATPase subunit I/STV1